MERTSPLASVSNALIFVVSKCISPVFTKSDSTLTEYWFPQLFLPNAARMSLWP